MVTIETFALWRSDGADMYGLWEMHCRGWFCDLESWNRFHSLSLLSRFPTSLLGVLALTKGQQNVCSVCIDHRSSETHIAGDAFLRLKILLPYFGAAERDRECVILCLSMAKSKNSRFRTHTDSVPHRERERGLSRLAMAQRRRARKVFFLR